MASKDAAERVLIARMGAHALHAQHDPKATTAKARQVRADHWAQQVDPDNQLPPEERARRAKHALQAHMIDLARRSAKARKRAASC